MKTSNQNRKSASRVQLLAACAFPDVHPTGGGATPAKATPAKATAPEAEAARRDRPAATRAPNGLFAAIASMMSSADALAGREPATNGTVADPAEVTAPTARSGRGDTTTIAVEAERSAGPEAPLAHLPWQPPMAPRKPGATQALLGLVGHSPECIGLVMSGRIASCDCRTKPMEDPAVAVGLVMHYARTAMTSRLPIPRVVLELLTQRVEEGDPTCTMVARWLDESGLIDITCRNSGTAGRAQ